MKNITILGFLLLITCQSFAQRNPENLQQDDEKLLYLTKVEKYRKMKNTGRILTFGGGVVAAVGVATLLNSSIEDSESGTTKIEGRPVLGAGIFLIGLAGLEAGIPLWIVGAHNEKKYNQKLENLSLKLNANAQRGAGFTLTYKF